MNARTRLEQSLSLTALGLLLIGCFVVMQPFLSSLMWAVVLGFTLWPVQRQLTRWLGDRPTLAAFGTTLLVATFLVVPFVVLGVSLADDARALTSASRKWLERGPHAPPAWLEKIPFVGSYAKESWKEFSEDLDQLWHQIKIVPEDGTETDAEPLPVPARVEPKPASEPGKPAAAGDFGADRVGTPRTDSVESRLAKVLRKVWSWSQNWLPKAGLAIGRGVIEVGLSVFLAFFIFRDGAAVADRLATGVARIAGDRGRHLLDVAGSTVRGVVYGILGTALVQGGMAAIGFLMAGVPGATLLGLLTFFLSAVPVGPPMIWIPATLWLLSEGSVGWGVFMGIWGIGVSSIDNLVKPWLISQGSNLPFILIFFGVIGGALAFGVIGVFLGPTLLAVAYRLIEEWSATRPVTPVEVASVVETESTSERPSSG